MNTQGQVEKEIVLLLGAGASKDFELPLVDELIEAFPQRARDLYRQAQDQAQNHKLLIEDFLQYLANIEHFQTDPAGRRILELMNYKSVGSSDIKSLNDEIRQSIRTQCKIKENMVDSAADVYKRLVQKAKEKTTYVRIFTTNYDLVVERAFDRCGFDLLDGFQKKGTDPMNIWQNNFRFDMHCLFKLHGSIGWCYSKESGQVWKATEAIDSENELLAYPLRQKPFFSEPFATIHSQYQQILRQTQKIFVVGFSFQDPNIVAPLKQQMELNRTQMWLVSPNALEIKEELDWQVPTINIIPKGFKAWVDNGAPEWCEAVEALELQFGSGSSLYLRSTRETHWPYWNRQG